MNNSLDGINQIVAIVSTAISIYYLFLALNACDKKTKWLVRLSLITLMPAVSAVFLYLMAGHSPHWSFTFVLLALSIKLASERRRVTLSISAKSDARR